MRKQVILIFASLFISGVPLVAFSDTGGADIQSAHEATPEKVEPEDSCLTLEAKKEAIQEFLRKEYGVSSDEVYPREEDRFHLRFYPGDSRCMGDVHVADNCHLQNVDMDSFPGAGEVESQTDVDDTSSMRLARLSNVKLVKQAIECW